jgi:hypothetical protein
MTLREEIKNLALSATTEASSLRHLDEIKLNYIIESFGHACIKLVLEREPTHKMITIGQAAINGIDANWQIRLDAGWRAMIAQLLKDIERPS